MVKNVKILVQKYETTVLRRDTKPSGVMSHAKKNGEFLYLNQHKTLAMKAGILFKKLESKNCDPIFYACVVMTKACK